MMVLGLGGPIGAGKSVVMRAMAHLYDIAAYDSDTRAKEVYFLSHIRQEIKDEVGVDPIREGRLDKGALRGVMGDVSKRNVLEEIVHRGVAEDFKAWRDTQTAEYVVLESAILFTSGFSEKCDVTIAVVADEGMRRERVWRRDPEMDFDRIEEIQRTERERAEREADFVIENSGTKSLVVQIETLFRTIQNR